MKASSGETFNQQTPQVKISCIAFDCGGVLIQDIPGIMFEKLSFRYPEEGLHISFSSHNTLKQ
jgi:hypothetical protein